MVAFAPEWRLVVAFVVGPRTQVQANLLLDRVVYVTDGRIPSFTSDQWSGYPTALLYAQAVKRREKGRVVEVTRKTVWGSADTLQARLAVSPTSTRINTRFVERDNPAWREHNRRADPQNDCFFQGVAVDGKTSVAVVGLLPFLLAPPQLAWGIAHTGTDPRSRIAPQMAARHAGHGRGHDGSCLDYSGTPGVSGTRPIAGYLGCHPTFVPGIG